MNYKKLIDAICVALEKLNKDGVEGWGLNPLYYDGVEFGELIQVGAEHGCTSETCSHSSHDPADAVYKWIPPDEYRLYFIGEDGERTFYHLTNDTEEHVIIRIDGGHYHDRLQWGDFKDVPEWILARLASTEEVIK